MYIEKIEIPAFRVLRDVALEFGEIYDPQVFPIGSENGGGKSTLLQLVFTLLHCSADPLRLGYLKNLLASDFYYGDNEARLIARLTVRIKDEIYPLEFISLHSRFLSQKLENPPRLGFDTWAELQTQATSMRRMEVRLERIRANAEQILTRPPEQELRPQDLIDLIDPDLPRHRAPRNTREFREYIIPEIQKLQQKIEDTGILREASRADIKRITGLLTALNHKHITTYYCPTPSGQETRALACHIPGQSASTTELLLSVVASKIFLLGPSNQQYLFLGKDARKALLGASPPRPRIAERKPNQQSRPQIEYLTRLDDAEQAMSGFYAYDWLSVDPLVKLFASARDEDLKNVVRTGSYGDSYTTLIREVNELLLGKKVRPLGNLSGVEFIIEDTNGQETPLNPEDLSQGELKRLMIYAWLRANRAVDALVLIDEIEASFHPDWQVGIVRDLQDWAPKNQYILATHSYELCQALTPRHVRDLQPRLPWRATSTSTDATKQQDSNDG